MFDCLILLPRVLNTRVKTNIPHALNIQIRASHIIPLAFELLANSSRMMLFASPKTTGDGQAPTTATHLAIYVSVMIFLNCFLIPGGPTSNSSTGSVSYLFLPSPPSEWRQVVTGFGELCQFPYCLGALYGKHVIIYRPQVTGATYRNYMGTLSILLMPLVDVYLNFMYARVGRNGQMNDSGVWAATSLRAHMGRGSAWFPEPAQLRNSSNVAPFVIIGNKGFRLKPCLSRPFLADELKDPETMFNYQQVEIVRSRFQVYGALLRQRPLRTVKVVKTTIALHNFRRKHNSSRRRCTAPKSLDAEDVLTGTVRGDRWRTDVNDKVIFPLQRIGGKPLTDAKAIWMVFNVYFWHKGQVSWQRKLLK
ncbi:uncharacterized protein LOC115330968 [Ixodes scapularis]|uniref:uncharacterized protein LOC115330968 n=1 Tax=Ixodes scapularis TaxID=6945 RepID=UPI001A9D8892|nr:uncharacterized protein LOC115330968 [Ixodes scapularis]